MPGDAPSVGVPGPEDPLDGIPMGLLLLLLPVSAVLLDDDEVLWVSIPVQTNPYTKPVQFKTCFPKKNS